MAANNAAKKTEEGTLSTAKSAGSTRKTTAKAGNASGKSRTSASTSGGVRKAGSTRPVSAKPQNTASRNLPEPVQKAPVRQASGSRQVKSQKARRSETFFEVRDICIFIVMVLLNLCMFLHTHMGSAGRAVYTAGIGSLGFSAYLLCVALLVFSILGIADRIYGNWAKVFAVIFMILGISVLLYVINGDLSLKKAEDMYKAALPSNGGAFGGIIAVRLVSFLGRIGSMVALSLCLLIPLVIITGKSVTRSVGQVATSTAREVRTLNEEHRRTKAERRRELDEKRYRDRRAMAGLSGDLRAQGIPVQKIHEPLTDPQGLTYDGEEVLDFPLYNDQDDFYLQKKRQHQRQVSGEQEKSETKKPVSAKKSPAKPAAKKEILEVKPEKEQPVKARPAAEPKIHMPSYDFGEPEFDESIPIHFSDPKPEKAEQAVLDDYVESAKEQSQLPAYKNNRPASVLPESMRAKEEALSEEEAKELVEELDASGLPVLQEYQFPPIELLSRGSGEENGESRDDLLRNARILENSLLSFGVEAKVLQVNKGPAVTRYELQPSEGVRVSRIMNLADDIALNLATSGIRIEGPIPGKKALGIEVPNKETTMVNLRDVIDSDAFRNLNSPLAFALGKDIDGNVQVTDIARMPHLLIAGATGSGKSVCINCLLMSILYKAKPEDVGLILIDPKVVELSVYNGIPHLLAPVVPDPKKAALSLNWAVTEMTKRYKQFSDAQVRDIKGFNEWVEANPDCGQPRMKRIIIVVDELADLMMVASKEVEDYICRLAQMARAAGIHLVIATQRPSVDVITGLIKANIPSRLAFAVSSGVDSRTILDMVGAEKLLGRGDMLFAPIGASKPYRIQGAYVSDHEVEDVVAAVKQPVTASNPDLEDAMKGIGASGGPGGGSEEDDLDEFLEQAIQYVVDKQKASISMLQRVFRIGFNRAARLMDALEDRGIVGPDEGSKPRKVLMTSEEYHSSEDDF